jgi:Uncharacterized protein conserved in bacteria
LNKKKVEPFSVAFTDDDTVIVPARDIHGRIWTLQYITLTQKQFLKDGRKTGMFHRLGFTELPDDYNDYIFIAEGYATSASIHMATDMPTICAFDAGNLVHVGKIIKKRWKNAQLVYCADVDYVGIQKAIDAANQTDGQVIVPIFNSDHHPDSNTQNDFNDLHCLDGLLEVNEKINLQLQLPKSLMKQAYEVYTNQISMNDIESEYRSVIKIIVVSF